MAKHKSTLRARYKGHTHGVGGVKCPCCGADSSKTVRAREKQELLAEVRRYTREDFE
jgi:hypothetical protein